MDLLILFFVFLGDLPRLTSPARQGGSSNGPSRLDVFGEAGRTTMYYVYVLKSLTDRKSYIGLTDNPTRRLSEHNSGKHFYTKRHIPWAIVWKQECDTLKDARAKEKHLKSAAGRRFLKSHVFKN